MGAYTHSHRHIDVRSKVTSHSLRHFSLSRSDYLNTTTSKLGDGSSIQSLGMSSPKHNKGNKNNGKGGKGASGNDRGRSVQGTPRDSQGLASRPRPGSPSLDTTSVASSATVARAQNDSTGTAHGNPKGVMADDATDSSAGSVL